MASVYCPRDRHYYRIEYKDQHGNWKKVTSNMRDRRAAEALGAAIEKDAERLRAGLHPEHPEVTGAYLDLPLGPGRRTWSEAVRLYLEDLVRRGSPEDGAYVNDCRKQLGKSAAFCTWQHLSDPSADSFTAFLDHLRSQGRAPRTLNKYPQCLQRFREWCLAKPRAWLRGNPTAGISRTRSGQAQRRRLRRAYTPSEWQALVATAPANRTVVYQIAVAGGLRRSELARLQKRDCTRKSPQPRWHLRPEVSKNRLAWNLPMLAECAQALLPLWEQASQPESPLFPPTGQGGDHRATVAIPKIATLYKDLEAAGVPHIDHRGRHADFHCFRYTFCKQLGQRLPIQMVKKLMRHLSLQMTVDLYTDLEMEEIGAELWQLPALFAATDTPPPSSLPLALPSNTTAAVDTNGRHT